MSTTTPAHTGKADCCSTHTPAQEKVHAIDASCHTDKANVQSGAAHAHHGHHAGGGSMWGLTTAATIHCLSGCVIGEFIGLAIGVSLGLSPWVTMALATTLGFASGYTLGLWPLVKRSMSWGAAFKTLWLGETISIAAMEFAMNLTDYHVGGVMASSMLAPSFWLGFSAAIPAGFAVAWPVNWLLLKRSIKQPCH